MGRVSDWLIEMEEDAFCMTRDEWTAKHGESCIDIYNKLRVEWLDEGVIPNEPQEHGKPDDAKSDDAKSTDAKDYPVY
tara:strand:- start:700 stop:933 length:234 start_codon:yes stop_codon:yes gene_type:complete